MFDEHKSPSGLAPAGESFRERLARQIAGNAPESNWSIIVGDAIVRAKSEPRPCRNCDGLGFVALSEARLTTFARRIADMRDEARRASSTGRLDAERHINENIRNEHWQLNRDSVCRTCRGSCYEMPEGEATKAHHDSMFTTVACLRCRGADRRGARVDDKGEALYPSLMDHHVGTGCGELMARNDAAADHQDACPDCMGPDGVGRGYVVPITARPMKKGGEEPDTYVEELDDVPVYHRNKAERIQDAPGALLARLRDDDPTLLAATAVLLGPLGDEWAQHRWGRRFTLWPITEAGRMLLEETDFDSDVDDWYRRKVEVVEAARAVVEDGGGSSRARSLVAMADRQSRSLELRVEHALKKAEVA